MCGRDGMKIGIALAILLAGAEIVKAQTQFPTPVHITADGETQPETFVGNILQAAPETPDCSHLSFGPHLTQAPDGVLGEYVFVFNMHVVPDNDRCSATDRQRLEILYGRDFELHTVRGEDCFTASLKFKLT